MKRFLILILLLIVLTACNELTVNNEINIGDIPDVTNKITELPQDNFQLHSKEEYDYRDYINEEEKIAFYQDKEIYFGEEMNQEEDKYLIYFFSPLCMYCNEFYSTLSMYSGLDNSYPIYKINVDVLENQDLWSVYDVKGTPTLILVDSKEEKVLDEWLGIVPIKELPTKENN